MLATGGTALADITGATLTTGTAATVFPGQSAQALPNVTVTIPDANGAGWSAGDFITFDLATDADPTHEVCNTNANLNQTAGLNAAPSVAGVTNGTTAFTNFSVTQGSTGNCSAKDQFTVAFTAGAPNDTNNTVFTISGLSVNLGTAVGTGDLFVSSSVNTLSADLAPTGVKVASIGSNSVTASPAVGAVNGASGVAISPVVVTDVTGNTIATTLKFTANAGDQFAKAGTLTAPSGVTVTGPSETLPASTLTYTIAAGTVPAQGKFTLTGATVNLANAAGSHKLTVGTGAGGATAVGGATEYAVTAAQVRTYAGVDRYGTARAAYHAQFAGATVAVLTSGENYPDALSAAALAKKLGTGILLTPAGSLAQDTRLELQSDPIATVYIVGGTAAISQAVQNAIAAMHVNNDPSQGLINVVRVAGADRYATNNAADLMAGAPGGTAVVATGTNFADALAVSPIVYAEGYALILTDPNTLVASAQSTLVNLGIKHVVIVGGTSAISATVETAIKGLNGGITVDYRVAGADRTATAAQIANWATAGLSAANGYSALNTGGLAPFNVAGNITTVFLARGDAFPDALATGPVAGAQSHVIVLSANPTTLGNAGDYLGGKAGAIDTISALGYASAVSPALVNAATAALG